MQHWTVSLVLFYLDQISLEIQSLPKWLGGRCAIDACMSFKLWMQGNQLNVWHKGFSLDVLRKKINIYKTYVCFQVFAEIQTFIVYSVCIHCDQKSGKCQRASDGKFHPSEHQQKSLFHPFFFPSCLFPCSFQPILSISLSLFFFSHPLRPGGWRGFGCTCGVAESTERINVLWEVSRESGLSLSFNVLFSLVLSPLGSAFLQDVCQPH